MNNPASSIPSPRRSSLLTQVRLSDGRLAWPVAQSAGMSEATFRARLKAGLSPDEATSRPVPARNAAAIRRNRSERLARSRAYNARIADKREARRKLSSRPARLDALADCYAGVIWSDGAFRVVVSPRGAEYVAQYCERGFWRAERAFPSASSLSVWVWVICEMSPTGGLYDALAALPDDPRDCHLRPYGGK